MYNNLFRTFPKTKPRCKPYTYKHHVIDTMIPMSSSLLLLLLFLLLVSSYIHITMEDKEKGKYNSWTQDETKVLIELHVEGIKRRWRDSSGIINKATVENKILPVLNERVGCQKLHKHYQSRIKFLKNLYNSYVDLQRNSSGFGWDFETKRFTTSEEVWQGYLKAHPNHQYMRYDSHEQFEDLKIIFDGTTANGGNSLGLSDTTDASTYLVGDYQVKEKFGESSDDVTDVAFVSKQNLKGHREKLIPRKRSRTDACYNSEELKNDDNDSIVAVSNKILNIIQQREERQQKETEKIEEKLRLEAEQQEAEKKKNNVWDAMKEITNLDQRTKFKAVTLIYSLGMKDVFAEMSVEERFGWIQTNLS
ncbi:hypothetical protein Bca4012_077119 [Brassica carinata]